MLVVVLVVVLVGGWDVTTIWVTQTIPLSLPSHLSEPSGSVSIIFNAHDPPGQRAPITRGTFGTLRGQVEVEGVMYQWSVTPEGLQLVPISGSKPEASRARSSQDTSKNIFTSRARSPFTPVNPKASNKQLVNRTPSPNRYRGMPSSWQERRRAASRSPPRVSTPGSAPGRIMAAATRQLFEGPRDAGVPSGLEGSRAVAVPPGFEGFPNVGGLVAKFEAQGSPESVRRSPKNRRVQMQVPEPQPQTPRTIKPTIVYPRRDPTSY